MNGRNSYTMKRIFSLIAVLMMAQMIFGAKVQVTNTSDDASEVGSLRWACETATAEDTIVFKFNKSGDKVIHINYGLTTEACVDGSTWADSIIIDGYNEEKDTYVFTALKTSGAFVKNIIVQNSDYGFSFQTASKVYDCIARNCKTYGFYCIKSVSFIRCKALNNGRYGFENYAEASSFEGCDAIGNGFYGVGNASRVINSNILNNRIGLVVHDVTVSSIEGCVISGNDSIGVVVGYHGTVKKLTDNVIGLSKDQKSSLPNGLGILNSSIIDTLSNNVISGNRKDGISDNSNSGIKYIRGNYVGTNKYFDKNPKLGNQKDGYVPGGTYAAFNDFSNNYFGNNGGYGIRTNGATNHSVTLKDCYFGVTPDGEAMPNGKGGINWGALHLTLQNCHVGYNDGIGIEYVRYGELVILGGEISYNKDEGISYVSIFSNLQVRNATLDSNGKDAISIDYKTGSPSLVTETKFLHTAKDYKAVNRTISLPVPEFTSCKVSSKTIDIVGKIDTAISAKIELFYTSQGNQTAEVLVDSVYTDVDGKFSFSLSRDNEIIKDVPLPAFTATATYFSSTSELSDVVYPETAVVDLIRNEFYVKVDGLGNGSSWETAMSPQTFAYTLPKVKDGTTFYVAEGTYYPMYDEDMNPGIGQNSVFLVNSDVTIKGGYPAEAQTGALCDPKEYETIFNGDIKGDNVEANEGSYIGQLYFKNYEDNVRKLFAQYGDFSLYGLTVKGCFVSTYNPWGPISMEKKNLKLNLRLVEFIGNGTCVNGSENSEIVIDSCFFEKNIACGSNGGAITNKGSLSVKNSYFNTCNTCNTGGAIYTYKGGNINIENTTFENCYAQSGSVIYINECDSFRSVNSTYTHNISNIGTIYSRDVAHLNLFNNTIISNINYMTNEGADGIILYGITDWNVEGNIIEGCDMPSTLNDLNLHANHNLFIEGTCITSSESNNVIIKYVDCPNIMDGSYDSDRNLFVANLSKNKGSTPTVKLLDDKISNDVEIRFPRIEGVLTDQRGMARRESTCMGAYEIPCEIDTTYAIDTISIGEVFHDSVYTVFGRHENVLVSLKTSEGCDSIISYTLLVRPNADSLNYYVKTERAGRGDGSSWENAMNGDDFEQTLPLVGDNVTFHIAEGVYTPHLRLNRRYHDGVYESYYTVNSYLKIVGGYPDTAKKGDIPDPSKFKTFFSGDPEGDDNVTFVKSITGRDSVVFNNYENDLHAIMYVSYQERGIGCGDDTIFYMSGISFTNGRTGLYLHHPIDGVAVLENNEFRNLERTIESGVSSILIKNCSFENNGEGYVRYHGEASCQRPVRIEKCLFLSNNDAICIAGLYGGWVYAENNTFYKNLLFSSKVQSNLRMSHNTIIDNGKLIYEYQQGLTNSIVMEGNIIDDLDIEETIFNKGNIAINSLYNIGNITSSSIFVVDENNIKIENPESLYLLLDGTYNSQTKRFTANLDYHGGVTRNIKLLKDKFTDGTFIRLPRLDKVMEDQRGVERLENTCMGSYEMKCRESNLELKDTILVGEPYTFHGQVLDQYTTKVGSYIISDTLTSKEGCDSIINLSLAVRPQKNDNGYYVKVDGTGDGSDWANAMSPESFAEYLPLVYDGETFHIAAGDYQSSYVDQERGRIYNINTSVTLIGGYPDTVSTVGVLPDPSFYTTRLTADVKGNDEFSLESYSLDRPYISGFSDNNPFLVCINGTPNVKLYGLTLSGVQSCENGAVFMFTGGTLDVDRCIFSGNLASAISANNAAVNMTNSVIVDNLAAQGTCFKLFDSELNVENSTLHKNIQDESECLSYEHASGAVAYLNRTKASFVNNTIANNGASLGAVFGLEESEVSMTNNTVIGNRTLTDEVNGGTLVNAWGSDSKIQLFGNLIVGNSESPVQNTLIESDGYNIFSSDWIDFVKGTDMVMSSSDYEDVIDGKSKSNQENIYVPTVEENGGYTPTIAVFRSLFEGGEVISIPAEARRVEMDQRGMVRKDTSCVGAFEFPTYVNYYVKKSPVGDGTGRDWDNAMGDTTFARYFSIVPAGATFHVAAGLYHPLQDRLYNSISNGYRRYYSSRPLNVYGGYHPEATIGAVAEPAKYATILSADINEDDIYTISSSDYSVMADKNYEDNSSYVMYFQTKTPGTIKLKGLQFTGNHTQFRGCSSALTIYKSADVDLNAYIDSCAFSKNAIGIFSNLDTLSINACRFDSIKEHAVSHSQDRRYSSLSVEKSSFHNVNSAVSAYMKEGDLLIQNSTFNNNMSAISVSSPSNAAINVGIRHNTISYYHKATLGVFVPTGANAEVVGNIFNTFVQFGAYGSESFDGTVHSDHNIFVREPQTVSGGWTQGEHDRVVASEDLVGVLSGKMDGDRFIADAKQLKKEDYTVVIPMEFDQFSDGEYVRMPIEEASVKFDQIATERLDLTSLGAFEMFSGRDTVISDKIDTVCLGLNYQRNGWDLQSDTLSEGIYSFERFARGKIATDTIFNLELHVNPFDHIKVDQVVAQPTLCHGDGYGIVSLTPSCDIPASAHFYVVNSFSDTVLSDVNSIGLMYKNDELLPGRYTLSINPITQCVVDTAITFEILDRDSLHIMPCADNILTSCANEPTSELKISLIGYHPTMKFYYDSVEVNSLTKGFELITDENAAVTSLADVNLSSIPVGFHTVYAIDACENQYPVKEFTVAVPANELVDMELVEYTMDSLPCGLDLGAAKVHVVAGASANFSLKSTNGYTYDRLFTDRDTVLSFEDLPRGRYEVLLKKYGTDCTDSVYASFEIKSPEPLSLSLTSNGAACVEGEVNVSAQGGRGNYVYHWTNPLGEKADSVSPILNEVSAGNYICVVEDSVHCMSLPDTLTILPNVENLLPLSVDSVAVKNITCFNGNNGTIEVYFSTENIKQSVACSVTNKETGEVIGTSDTYEHSKGLLAIRTLPVGSFSYEVYYGTETCRLDTTSFKGEFSVAAKEVPFAMDPLKIFSPQTCLSDPDGVTVNSATGWEEDYMVNLISSSGGIFPMTPVVEGGVTKLYAAKLSGGHTYYYQVLDACGSEMLTESVEFPLYEPLALTVDSYTDSVTCARANDAQISFTVSGGILDNHKAFVNDSVFDEKGSVVCDQIGKGDYYVSFKSVNASCPDSVGQYVRIAGPDTLAIKYTLTGNCATSKLIASASGECGSYSYLWSDGEQSVEGDENIPFALEAGRSYSLTITDDHGCDQFEKSFAIPTADQLPSISQKVYPESEKCYQGNNGSILVKPSLSAPLDFAITATVSYRMVGSDDSVSVECVLDPDNSYSTPRALAPGEYQVVTYLGSIDCDMGVAPAVKTVKVDALPPLKIQSEFAVTDHTCFSPNGAVQFNVEGWTYTHTADIYKVGAESGLYLSDVKPKSTTPEYVGVFDVQSMPYGLYKVVVKDICGNSDESQAFEIQYKPSTIANVSTKGLTCINEPNGVLEFEVHGWTPLHGCSIVKNDNVADGRISPALPVSIDEESKIAYFSIDTMTAGNWRIWVSNECREAFRLDTFATVKGIAPYKIDLEPEHSKLELDCPYDKDGVVALNVTGGYVESLFLGSSTKVVQYYGPTGEYVDSFVIKLDTSYVVTPKYDSLNPIVTYDTTYKVASQEKTTIERDGVVVDTVIFLYDTIVVSNTSYPQLVDVDGNFINDTTIRIDSFSVEQRVEKYGVLDSLETSPISYDIFTADPVGSLSGRYRYINLGAGTYRFTYKSALKGCSDKIDFDTRVTKPADVNLNRAVMPISCSTFSDGVISLAPRRGGKSYPYFVAHDSTDAYNVNRLYVDDKDLGVVEFRPNGETLSYRIDTLYDQSDIKSIAWSYNSYKNEGWKVLDNIVFPDSTDITEEIYYKGADIIKTPVYSNSHLEPFWHDKMGESFESNVVTISNLPAGYYAVLVQDAKACKYRDTFEVKLPDSPLKIDSVVFDAELAACDPTQRQILAYASGGWGEYNFTFSDKSKVESSLGEQSDGFRGGEATHYDKATVSGWGVSQFLDPGNYTVVVLDEQGCVVESEKTYPVTSRITLHIDSTRTKCPEDPTAAVEIKFVEGYTEGKNYQVVEYTSPCRTDTLDECRDQALVEMHESIAPSHYVGEKGDYRYIPVDLTSLKMRSKTHGLFVYEVDDKHCGTYVQGTVVDTIPIFKSSSKSVRNVSCNGLADGVIELYVSGGSAPYQVQRNSSWNSADEMARYKDLKLETSTITITMRDPETGDPVKDTTIVNTYLTVSDTLRAGDYYLTVIDALGCKSVMGDTATFDEKVVVKEPEKLEAEFAASFVCKEPSVTKGGNLFLKNVKGGVAPYVFSYGYNYGGETVYKDNCQSIEEIPVASPGFTVSVEVKDANQCETKSGVVFQEGELQVDTFDFWASTWYEFGDVVALIDVCGPEATFDSVSYVFYDEFHNVDPRIKMLDKRLYIYDLDANKAAADTVRRYGDRTMEMVPDAYFEKRFNLRPEISKGQARHMNFFKFEDSSIDLKYIKDNHIMSEALANHSVLMKAYFLGCEYQLEERADFFHVINPNNNPPYTPIGQRYQIISLAASPNPFKDGEKIEIRAVFTEMVKEAKLRVYHIDGKTSKTIDIHSSDLTQEDGEYVFKRSFLPSDLFGSASMPDYAIIFLTTGQDQKSATLLHNGVIEDYWR